MFGNLISNNSFHGRMLRLAALIVTLAALLPCCQRSERPGAENGQLSPTPEPGVVRVVCWNIEWFPGKSRSASPERQARHTEEIRDVLTKLQPDILLAQEIRSEEPLLAALSGVPGHQLGVISRSPGTQQMATTGTLPIVAAWFERWERDGIDDAPRGFSHVSFRLPDGRLLLTYNLHLKSNAGGEPSSNRAKREDAVRQLLAHLNSELPKYREQAAPAILIAGDFNTDPDAAQFSGERTIPMLLEAGFASAHSGLPKSERITWPSNGRYPDATFDFVFSKGLEVKRVEVPATFDAYSDHRPVVVDFR
jgi:endonuclease/exonuclease/phosphatase family metal-dependent hydrolase